MQRGAQFTMLRAVDFERHKVGGSKRAASDHPVVLSMRSNPEPHDVRPLFHGERSIVQPHSG